MWFDVTAALAEIEGGAEPAPEARPPATSATPATQTPKPRPVSQLSQVSQVSQAPEAGTVPRVATVANVATPSAPAATVLAREPEAPAQPAPRSPSRQERATPSKPNGDDMGRHGRSVTGAPLTWTGRLVKPDAWGTLSAWERHGPDGRLWCGCCRAWVARETALAHADTARAEWITAKGQ